MKKVVEHFQSNRSTGLPVGQSVCRTDPLMEVVPPPRKVFNELALSVRCPGALHPQTRQGVVHGKFGLYRSQESSRSELDVSWSVPEALTITILPSLLLLHRTIRQMYALNLN